jgi:DNA-binding YbaB/EbfC family protein
MTDQPSPEPTDLPVPVEPVELTEPSGGLADLLGGGGLDMSALLEQAMEMQQQLIEAQSAAAETVVEGQAGGGAVVIRVTAGLHFESVTISPAAVDPDDVELLQDLVLAALHDAVDQITTVQRSSMGGLDLGSMGDMLGLGGSADDEFDEDDEDDDEDGTETSAP